MWPPRYLLRTIEAVSILHRQSGASSRAREAHGVLPNSHHDPSSRGARDIAESAFQLIFREGSRSGFPGAGKGLIKNSDRTKQHANPAQRPKTQGFIPRFESGSHKVQRVFDGFKDKIYLTSITYNC